MFSRSEIKKAAAAAEAAESAESDVASDADEPAPTSDVEMPDPVGDDGGSDDDNEDNKPEDSKKKKSNGKEKAKSTSKGKGKGKGKGGIMMPDEWPWEDAKKIFEKPDVLPADAVEVSPCRSIQGFYLMISVVGVEQPRRRWSCSVPSNRKRVQASPSTQHLSGRD